MVLNVRDSFDWFFRDKRGNVVVWQAPNIPLWIWILCTLASKVVRPGTLHGGLQVLGQAFLLTWAYGELRSGASIFRRVLGGVIITGIVMSLFR